MGLYTIVTHVNSHKLRLWVSAKLASLSRLETLLAAQKFSKYAFFSKNWRSIDVKQGKS